MAPMSRDEALSVLPITVHCTIFPHTFRPSLTLTVYTRSNSQSGRGDYTSRMAVISFLRSPRDWPDGSEDWWWWGRGGEEEEESSRVVTESAESRGRFTCSQWKKHASVARERFSWQLRVFAQLRNIAHVSVSSVYSTSRNCAIVSRIRTRSSRASQPVSQSSSSPRVGHARVCLDSRVCLAGKRARRAILRAYLRSVKGD